MPSDYLKQVVTFEKNKMRSAPVSLVVNAREPISSLTKVIGATWLDETLRDVEDNLQAEGLKSFAHHIYCLNVKSGAK